tara:strand:+ start:1462 stop:1662 length:201 start_codon:yes stop_codon:yes gene_type:complete
MKVKLKEKSVIVGAVQYNANREYVMKDEVGKELIDSGMAIEIKEAKVKKETKEHKQNSKETKNEAK